MCSTPEVALDDEEPGSARQPYPLAGLRPISPQPAGPTREGDPPDPPITLDSLTKAIDELAADSRDGTASPQLAQRIAGLWAMVSDLDPELARRRAAYEGTERPGE